MGESENRIGSPGRGFEVRIISGEFRSRRLEFPKSKRTRPMMDRAKEMIFNILGNTVPGAKVLDLFAGSGSLGLEALSRGANEVIFVEKGPWAVKTIRSNLEKLNLRGKALVLPQDVFRALNRFEKEGRTFNLIFLDPPYNQGVVKKILNRLGRSDIVTPLTQLILHRSRQEKLPETLERLEVLREKRFGQACLSFLSGRNKE